MNYILFLRALLKGNKTFFDVPSSEQKSFLETLPVPVDDIDRSYLQFRCQAFFSPIWKRHLLDLISFILYIPLLVIFLLRNFFIKSKDTCDAISDLCEMKEVIPQEIHKQHEIVFVCSSHIGVLSVKDIPFLFSIYFRHFPSCYFAMKNMVKIAQYNQLIRMYSPRCIIAHHEYSFSSSILTLYCNMKNIQHINVMHGEKLYNIVDAFFHFNECYVWSHHYEQLFIDLKAEKTQFKISMPPSMRIDTSAHINDAVYADYKYFIASVTEEQVKSIVESMMFAVNAGKRVKYRLHPRINNLNLLLQYIAPDDIEDPQKVSITDSISNCSVAVGSYSTVLNQAYCSGRSVLLDDITFKDQYERLADLRYWLIGEGCPRLSEMQKK